MKLLKLTQDHLAAALGVSQPMVSRLKARGMPTDDIVAARRWRETHLDPCLVKSIRRPDSASASADRSGDDRAFRAVGPGAGLDLHVYGLLWAARPWTPGGIGRVAENGVQLTRADIAIVHSAVCAALATVLEEAGEPESTLWHLAGMPVWISSGRLQKSAPPPCALSGPPSMLPMSTNQGNAMTPSRPASPTAGFPSRRSRPMASRPHHPSRAGPAARGCGRSIDAADLDTLLQPVGVRGEFLLAQVTFPTLASLAVGVTSAGHVLPDPGADRELLAAALRRVLDLLRPEPAPPPRSWWRRLLRRA